jgi:hypothetical protein
LFTSVLVLRSSLVPKTKPTLPNPDGAITEADVKVFLNNAQVALCGPGIHAERLDYLVAYATLLEEALLSGQALTRSELAYILVSIAYDIKFPSKEKV